jgi:hypothetical protein
MRGLAVTAAAALCVAAVPVPAAPMTVAQFLAKAKTVQARGMLAVGSADLKALQDEILRVARAYRASPASRPPQSCPPPPGKSKMTAQQLIAELERIPAAQRNMSMDAAFAAIMKRNYPCKR